MKKSPIRNFLKMISMVTAFGCSSPNMAPDKIYYYEIEASGKNELVKQFANELATNLGSKKYTITNQSGLVFPYYRELDLDQKIPLDSLMPPHTFVHRLVLRKKNMKIDSDSFFLKIKLMPVTDTIPNYELNIYKVWRDSLEKIAGTDIHFIDSSEFSNQNELKRLWYRSIVRYSFK